MQMPGLLSKALRGLGEGMAKGGEMMWREELEQARQERLLELAQARDDAKYQRDRADKVADTADERKWQLEKLETEYDLKAQLKGVGRGGSGGGLVPLLDAEGNPLLDENGEQRYTSRRSSSGGSSGGGSGGRSGKGSGSGGDAASMYESKTVNGVEMSCNKRTGDCRPFTITTPGKEFKPETLGIDDEQKLEQGNKAAQLAAAKRDNLPVSKEPGYRSEATTQVVKGAKADEGTLKENEFKLRVLESYDKAKAAHTEQQASLPSSKRTPFMSEEEYGKRLSGGLLGSAREAAAPPPSPLPPQNPRTGQGVPANMAARRKIAEERLLAIVNAKDATPESVQEAVAAWKLHNFGALPDWFVRLSKTNGK